MEPTNRELKIMLDDLARHEEEKHGEVSSTLQEIKSDIKDIKIQTTKTNGRVNRHDWIMNAFIFILGIAGSAIVFLAPYVLTIIKTEIQLQKIGRAHV